MKKILLTMAAVMLLLISTAVPAFAADTTTTGEGDVSATVPVEGTIEALTISVTHPATITYSTRSKHWRYIWNNCTGHFTC